jgi:ribosomal protein L24
MHLCPKCQTGVRVTMKETSDGERERYCKRCGETIPKVK